MCTQNVYSGPGHAYHIVGIVVTEHLLKGMQIKRH